MRKSFLSLIVFLIVSILLVSCSSKENGDYYNGLYASSDEMDSMFAEGMDISGIGTSGEGYNKITEFPFVSTNDTNETFFTLDSNTGSYSNLRRYIEQGQAINGDIIKTDELINYFKYDLSEPASGETFSITADMMETPWNSETQLITIGVKSKTVELSPNLRNNLVFLIDVSGSMTSSDKLGLIKEAFPMMLDSLNPDDTISIVTYANGVKTYLSGCKVSNKNQIVSVISGLSAGGSTWGSGGLDEAYKVARENFIEGGNNRIILATDGDFNVGNYSNEALKQQVAQQLASGIYLSVLGVGMGNYQDDMVETLAMNGNGNYAYIDSLIEAKKVLTEDLATTLISVAKDVKVKVEFNSELIDEYRVIGYENKQITEEEFENEEVDASEVGSGHTTVVTYEVKLKESILPSNANLLNVTMNYKDPETDAVKTVTDSFNVNEINQEKSEDFIFVSCLVEFSLVLRNSEYKGNASLQNIMTRLNSLNNLQDDVYKLEFKELVQKVIDKNLA